VHVRPVLVAPDSFKGTLRATEVAAALGRGLEAGGLAVDLCPVADGGEGTLEVLLLALGGETGGATVAGPLGAPVRAGYALLEDGAGALVEVAGASGLGLVDPDARDAAAASTRGTGELIVAAAATGAEVVFVAAGGSATTDGGAGALEAIAESGGLGGAQLVVLCDVRTPWEEAARTFSPQKGADPVTVDRLAARLEKLAGELPRDPRGVPFTGAAGGLAGGLWAALGARLESGAAFVLSALGFDARMLAARAVVVGEGRIDEQTLRGKIAGEIATRARQKGVPAHAVVGENSLDPFEQRILDLGAIIEGGNPAALEAAGTALAEVI
jgi:glycerate kinase